MLSHASIWKAIDALASQHNISPSGLAKLAGLDPTTFNPSKRFKANGKPRWPSTESIAKILDVTNASPSLFFSRHWESVTRQSLPALEKKSLPDPPDEYASALASGPDLLPVPSGTVPLWLEETPSDISKPFNNPSNPQASRTYSNIQTDLYSTFDANIPAPVSSLSDKSDMGAKQEDHLVEDFISFPAPAAEPVFALAICNNELEPAYQCGDTLLVSPNASLRFGDRVLAKSREGRLSVHSLIRATARNLIVHPLGNPKAENILALKDLYWKARILWVSQ